MRSVHVTLHVPPGLPAARAARVVVRVEDVSRADGAAVVVGERRLGETRLVSGAALECDVDVPEDRIESAASYCVRVTAHFHNEELLKRGDLTTTRSHPVLTSGAPDRAVVPLSWVAGSPPS